jgi:L-cysteine/cystine lyase
VSWSTGALAPTALAQLDASAMSGPQMAAALAALDVLGSHGWPLVHARAIAGAHELARRLLDEGYVVAPRGDSTLVSWSVGAPEAALRERERLAAGGVIVRDLPGTGRLRASVGAWNDAADLDRLLELLG